MGLHIPPFWCYFHSFYILSSIFFLSASVICIFLKPKPPVHFPLQDNVVMGLLKQTNYVFNHIFSLIIYFLQFLFSCPPTSCYAANAVQSLFLINYSEIPQRNNPITFSSFRFFKNLIFGNTTIVLCSSHKVQGAGLSNTSTFILVGQSLKMLASGDNCKQTEQMGKGKQSSQFHSLFKSCFVSYC